MKLKIQNILSSRFLVIILLVFFARLLFSIFVPLIDDEAYHWSWTLKLDWSYFDHPGMIAWLEKISTLVLGQTYLAIRLPSYLCFAACTYVTYKLTKDLFGEKPAQLAVVLLLLIPFYGFGGLVAAPETPYILCWMLAAYIFWQRVRADDLRWSVSKTWLLLGLTTALGINSKLITVLMVAGIGLFCLFDHRMREDLKTKWPWIGIGIFFLGFLPIILWNQQYDWPSFKFQFQERHAENHYSFTRWLGFLGAQIAFLTPFLYALILITFANSIYQIKNAAWKFLFFLSVPSFFVFYPQPFKADYKPHWCGTAYLILLMGACSIYYSGLIFKNKVLIKPQSSWLKYGFLYIAVPLNFFLYVPVMTPFIPQIYSIFKDKETWDPKFDPTNEFYGWEEVGKYVIDKKNQIDPLRKNTFLAASRYETTAQLTWGTKEKVYMLSKTRSQYTIEQKEMIPQLIGLNALFVMSDKYIVDPLRFAQFDSCQKEVFPFYRGEFLARNFIIYHCKNFRKILR